MDTGAVPELLILAPAHERGMSELWQAASANQFACPADQPFNPWIEAFLDEGVNFAFDDDHRLPTELPDDLTGCGALFWSERCRTSCGPASGLSSCWRSRPLGDTCFRRRRRHCGLGHLLA